MSIYLNNIVNKIANNKTARNIASQMCNHKALLPVIMLESTVVAGRSYQAYKRGGITEFRERILDESFTAVVWFGIITWLNAGFNKLIKQKGIFNKKGLPEITIDVGKDAIRNPIRQAIRKRPEIQNVIGGLKVSKIALSAFAGIYLSGFVLPKFYQNMTRKILHREKLKKQREQYNSQKIEMNEFLNKTNKKNKVSFGSAAAINTMAHILENNPIAKLMTMDAGLFIGRAYNARNNDERREILFRDFVSTFFYLLSTPLIYKALSKYVDRFKGKNNAIDPNTAHFVTSYLQQKIKKQSYNTAQFAKATLGDNEKIVSQLISRINTDTVGIQDFERIVKATVKDASKAEQIIANAREFIKLRPQGASKYALTISEVINSAQGGFINDPKFLTRAVKIATKGASQNPEKFVSYKEIDRIKNGIKQYAESVVQMARQNRKVSKDILTIARNRNMITKVGYTLVGLAVSAAFLSTIIPKIQYKITEMKTGNKEFPGIRDIK